MKIHIKHKLSEANINWGDFLRLGSISKLQLQDESCAYTLTAQPEYTLLYLQEGVLYLVRNRVESMFTTGNLVLLPPEEEYHLHFPGTQHTTAWWISFSGYSITRLLIDSGLMNRPVFQMPPEAELSYHFDGILRQSIPSADDPRRIALNCMGLFMQLLGSVMPYTIKRRIPARNNTPAKSSARGGSQSVTYAVQQIQSDLSLPLNVEEMARSLQLSSSHFIRSFKAQMGYSPLAYQTCLRMERAKDLLRSTTLRISEVAAKVGYQNPMYFSSTFKKHVGMTPLEYREKFLSPPTQESMQLL